MARLSKLFVLCGLALTAAAVAPPLASQECGKQEVNRNITFGMPVGPAGEAKADPKQRENYLIARPQFVLSYNDTTKTPNWVSWQLVKSDVGKVPRGPFVEDKELPPGFTRVTPKTYASGGFDRGHMCPSKDRSDTEENNDAVFVMTNMVPQSPNNNEKTWEHLEDYCRSLAQGGNVLYIVAGPHGKGGIGKLGFRNTIGQGKVQVTVPAHTWKVIMVLDAKKPQPSKRTRMIAVIVPNVQTVDPDWTKYRVSVNEVEELTGYKFFPSLPEDVATAIKAEPDTTVIETSAAKGKKKANPD
jgi:endonuclease G